MSKVRNEQSEQEEGTPYNEQDTAQSQAIRELNDAFRKSFSGGAVMITSGIIALGRIEQIKILEAVKCFHAFDAKNDPYREHDFGSFQHGSECIMFKIDYYDPDLVHGSKDPADPSLTKRVLTIMLASEY